MKKWMEKLIQQFDFEWDKNGAGPGEGLGDRKKISSLGEDRATLLFILDTYNKHLMEIEGHSLRKTRETLDEYAKELISPRDKNPERVLFRLRQFFSAYRIDETTYFQKTFEDFRTIIWDFVDQLAEDVGHEEKEDFEMRQSLDELKEAVESNSIDDLKNRSRKFIDSYIEKQYKKDKRRKTRMKSIRKNLTKVKKQLGEASSAARTDHLTNAYNRKTFDEYCAHFVKLLQASGQQCSLLLVDIDHFKRINDTYGHPIGDFILKELVGTLKNVFTREGDLVARIGGEEFAIILPDYNAEQALKKADELMAKVRAEVYVQDHHQIRFTVSMGIAQLTSQEEVACWVKRADLALYNSKNTGRNRATVAPSPLTRVA